MEYILKIQNVAGVGNLKWSKKQPDSLYSCALTMDNILSLWNINSIYHPQFIFRGHKENITDFVFNEQDGYIITSSKDSNLIYHNFDEAFYYSNFTNKCPLNFDKDDNLIFRAEFNDKNHFLKEKDKKSSDFPSIYNLKDQFPTPIMLINGIKFLLS